MQFTFFAVCCQAGVICRADAFARFLAVEGVGFLKSGFLKKCDSVLPSSIIIAGNQNKNVAIQKCFLFLVEGSLEDVTSYSE
jgi:hypothetical protein